ncbi:hypothetical protein Alches_22120 [Alicyclobacillus hesperidum subsp. aegles]|uniref:hypothetical protein n=1 Tax=Alicyclobacillus hesperidum TaxID=89784 RepID=UPI00222CF598|nr:hypothetical protein [Alicyclobacillus hesperidum]GLG02171.1 hypothetical protein Alches_22120 [Alicyclobacillus hesperidum subsp. aegles]
MRIFAKKAYKFHHPTGAEAPVSVRVLDFTDVPDWVQHSTMFQWALEDETVTVVNSKADEIAAEKAATRRSKAGE